MIDLDLASKLVQWANEFELEFKEEYNTPYNYHIIIHEKNRPSVDIIHKTLDDKFLLFASRVNVAQDHVNAHINKSPEEINEFTSKLKQLLLLMNVEYVSTNLISEFPTHWEVLNKIHIEDISPNLFLESYLRIKNAIYMIIISIQNGAIQQSKVTSSYVGKIIESTIGENNLMLDMPRSPNEAHLSFRIESLFRNYIGKNVKINIEELQ